MAVQINLDPTHKVHPLGFAPTVSLTLSGASVTPDSVTWDFGDGVQASGLTPQHSYSAIGDYTIQVRVTYTVNEVQQADDASIVVRSKLSAGLDIPINQGEAPLRIAPTVSSNSTTYTVAWDFGDGTTSSDRAPEHTYTARGIYTVTATVVHGAFTLVLRDSVSVVDDTTTYRQWCKLDVPNYLNATAQSDAKRSYLRLGATDPNGFDKEFFGSCGKYKDSLQLNKNGALDGLLSYTDGNRTVYTQGNKEEYVQGKHRLTIQGGGLGLWDSGYALVNYFRKTGSLFGATLWRHTTVDHSSSDSYQFGDSESFFGGFTFSGSAGLSTGVTVGGSFQVGAAWNVDVGLSFDVSKKKGDNVDLCEEGQNTLLAKNHDIVASESIQIRTKSKYEATADKVESATTEKTLKAYAAATTMGLAAVAVGAVGVAIPWWSAIEGAASDDGKGDSETDYSTWLSTIGMTLATAAWAKALFEGKKKNRLVDSGVKLAPSMVEVDPKRVRIAFGGPAGQGFPLASYIELTDDGITISSGGKFGSSIKVSSSGIEFQVASPKTKFKMDASGYDFKSSAFEVTTTGAIKLLGMGGVSVAGKPPALTKW